MKQYNKSFGVLTQHAAAAALSACCSPAKRQQILPGAARTSAAVPPGFSQTDVAQMLQLFAGNSGPSGAAADTTAPQRQLNLIAGLHQQQQPVASHGLPAALLAALPQLALPQLAPQLPHSSAALSSLLGRFQPGPSGPTPAVAGIPAAHLAAQPLQQLGLAAAAGVPALPLQPMAATGLASDAVLAGLQQQLFQQQLFQQQQRHQALATAQEQLLVEAAFAASLSAAASQIPPPQMLANTSVAAAPSATAVGGIAPAAAVNLIQLLAAGADVGSLMATVPNRQLLPPPGAGSGGQALQRRLLQQLQPSLLPTVHGAPAAINPQLAQQQPANLGGLQQCAVSMLAAPAAAAVAQPSHPLTALSAFNMLSQGLPAGYLQPGQQQGVGPTVTGVPFPEQQALLQLQALGGQAPAQQQAQGNGQMDPQSAAALIQALTAAAHRMLNLPALPSVPPQQAVSAPAALLPAGPAAPPAAPAAPWAAALAALSAPILPSLQPAIPAAALAAQPAAELSAAVAVPQTAAQAAAAAAAVSSAPGVGLAALAPPAASVAAAVPPAATPAGLVAPWLQDSRAALAALAALGAVAPPFTGAVGGIVPGAGGAVGDAAGLVRFESVGGQSPVMSEETVESEESEHGEGSEGQGSSSSRAK